MTYTLRIRAYLHYYLRPKFIITLYKIFMVVLRRKQIWKLRVVCNALKLCIIPLLAKQFRASSLTKWQTSIALRPTTRKHSECANASGDCYKLCLGHFTRCGRRDAATRYEYLRADKRWSGWSISEPVDLWYKYMARWFTTRWKSLAGSADLLVVFYTAVLRF